MGRLLSYSILSGIYLLMLYGAYMLFLAREKQPRYNRAILLSIYAVAFAAAPLTELFRHLMSGESPGVIAAIEGGVSDAIVIGAPSTRLWTTWLIWVYFAGIVAIGLRTLLTWVSLIRVVGKGERITVGGFTVVVTDDKRLAPFSWLRFIVVNRADYAAETSAIVAHEKAHIAGGHWIDLLIARAVCIINWFNPAAWMMQRELMLVHEYEADQAVLDNGFAPEEYQLLLIKKAVGAGFPSLANSLNHSKLKKRITMMYKANSGKGSRLRALAIVPALAVALAVVCVPAVSGAVSAIASGSLSPDKVSEKTPSENLTEMNFRVKSVSCNKDMTTIVIEGVDLGATLSTSDATLTKGFTTYSCSAMSTNMTNGTAIIKADFPTGGDYEGASVAVTVNGERMTFDNLPSPAEGEYDSAGSAPKIRIYNSSPDSVPDYRIFINGQEVSKDAVESIAPETIESITVNKQTNEMHITLKK